MIFIDLALSMHLKKIKFIKAIFNYFYDRRHRHIPFRQRTDLISMNQIYMPFQIMKVGDEFYMKNVTLETSEKCVSRVSDLVRKRFVVHQDGDLIKVIRIR